MCALLKNDPKFFYNFLKLKFSSKRFPIKSIFFLNFSNIFLIFANFFETSHNIFNEFIQTVANFIQDCRNFTKIYASSIIIFYLVKIFPKISSIFSQTFSKWLWNFSKILNKKYLKFTKTLAIKYILKFS